MLERYLAKPRNYTYGGIALVVQPGVFHPGFFFSTKLFLKFLKTKDLNGKHVLEIGAGSGLISLYLASIGANATAIDISRTAIDNIKTNAEINELKLNILYSDMFSNLPAQKFDTIIIAPPYYKKHPQKEAEHAWYCGESGEYFSKLFSKLGDYIHGDSKAWMILSDDCDIDMIQSIATGNGFGMKVVFEREKYWETNYIYEIHQIG